MNKVILIGRLTRDPEIKTTQNDVSFCNFSIAVDRRFKDANGEKQTDFINCVAWRQQADVLGKYFAKGHRIGIVGTLQTRSYEVDGQRRFATDVVVEEIDFIETKQDKTAEPAAPSVQSRSIESTFFPTPADDDTALPFDL